VEREREPVTPVDRQQLLVGHGAECMVGQEVRAGPGATATAISSMGSGPARAWTCTGPFEPRFGRSGARFERSVPGDRECGRIGLRCGIAPRGLENWSTPLSPTTGWRGCARQVKPLFRRQAHLFLIMLWILSRPPAHTASLNTSAAATIQINAGTAVAMVAAFRP
jgi:hypothetical protein